MTKKERAQCLTDDPENGYKKVRADIVREVNEEREKALEAERKRKEKAMDDDHVEAVAKVTLILLVAFVLSLAVWSVRAVYLANGSIF